jgi:hypothetical protein
LASAEVCVSALAALRLDTRLLVAGAASDGSFGALRLIDPALVLEADHFWPDRATDPTRRPNRARPMKRCCKCAADHDDVPLA